MRKHSTNRCHAYIFDIAIGSARELAPSEILSADSTDYLLGGSLTLRNGRIDKLQFEEGYCQAVEYSGNASQDDIYFYYYDRDHLGNIRQVVKAGRTTNGTVVQTMDYYPLGAQFCDGSTDSNVQSRKYNGKELDRMHGLDTYDYGARQYNPVTARWDRMDPMCEKYYDVSPYAYCHDNPVNRIDVYGMWDTLNISNNKNNVMCVIPTQYKNDGALRSDYNSASNLGLPNILVKNVKDFANALTAIGANNIKPIVTLNSHGKPGLFYIGKDKVTKDTDLSRLELLSQSQIVITACRAAEGEKGEQLLEHIVDQLTCTVYGSCHYVKGGYKYDNSVMKGGKKSSTYEMNGKQYSKDNLFKVSNLNGTKYIFDLSIDKVNGLKFNEWNPIQIQ